jgi:hypothetical protein
VVVIGSFEVSAEKGVSLISNLDVLAFLRLRTTTGDDDSSDEVLPRLVLDSFDSGESEVPKPDQFENLLEAQSKDPSAAMLSRYLPKSVVQCVCVGVGMGGLLPNGCFRLRWLGCVVVEGLRQRMMAAAICPREYQWLGMDVIVERNMVDNRGVMKA